MFISGFVKIAKMSDEDKSTLKKGALIGAGVGAVKNLTHDAILNRRENLAPKAKTTNALKNKLQKGDILVVGSNDSGSYAVEDLPKPIRSIANKLGISKKKKIAGLSQALNLVGAGGKYHAGIYTGNGRVAHMYPTEGAHTMSLKDVSDRSNVTAYRLKKSKTSQKETDSAVKFTKKVVREKVPYKNLKGQIKEPLSNIALPSMIGGSRAKRCTKDGLVCHTLPTMAYDKQKFAKGSKTYAGDIKRNLNFVPVATKNTNKIQTSLKVRGAVGQGLKGLKYAAPGAALAYAYHKYRQHKDK